MRLNEVEGFEVKDLILAKFTKSEFVEDFLNGNLFMNNFNHFIEQEKRTKEKGQGDSFEAALVTEAQEIRVYDQDSNLIATSKSGNMIERYEDVKQVPLYCMALFDSKDFLVIEQTEDSISFKLDILDEDKEKLKLVFQADKVILTFSPGVFVKRVKDTMMQTDPNFLCGSVKYVDYSVMDNQRRKNFDEMRPEFLFTKHRSLEYQREYRFILPGIRSSTPYVCNIGDLRNLFNVITVDQFLDECIIQMNFK
jgi:hypothetical protein